MPIYTVQDVFAPQDEMCVAADSRADAQATYFYMTTGKRLEDYSPEAKREIEMRLRVHVQVPSGAIA